MIQGLPSRCLHVSRGAGSSTVLLVDGVLDALFPVDCLGCARRLRGVGAHAGPLCESCRAAAVAPPPPLCGRCGVPVAATTAVAADEPCSVCRAWPPAFTVARGAAHYDPALPLPPLVRAVHELKYRGVRALAGALASLITTRLPIPPGVVVVPVPLHRTRLRERRFNQAVLIGRAVARRAERPCLLRTLVRRHPTPSQIGLPAAERRRNLHEAFSVVDPRPIAGRHVLLIDDVITTGATVDACARTLLLAGARRVDAYAVGRTPRGARA